MGSHLVDRLVKKGHEVAVIDNLITGSLANLDQWNGDPRVEFIEADVSDYIDVSGDVDYVFHFASPASPLDFIRFPIPVLKAGALGTHNTLGLAKAKGASYFLASTSEVYGDPLVSPQPETYWGNVNPIGPRGVYDEAKRFAEAMTMAYHRYHGLNTHIVRFFNTYGPRMRLDDGRVVPNFVAQALKGEPLTIYGDGQQTRSFGFYADIIEGVYRLALSDFHEPVNLGTHDEFTIADFAKLVIEISGSKSSITHLEALPDDPRRRRPDLTRAQTILNWQAQTSLNQGLNETIAFFRKSIQAQVSA